VLGNASTVRSASARATAGSNSSVSWFRGRWGAGFSSWRGGGKGWGEREGLWVDPPIGPGMTGSGKVLISVQETSWKHAYP